MDLQPIQHRQCREGYFAFNVRDWYVGKSLHRYGEFSNGEVDLFKQLLKPGQTVVEAGANIGAHTVPIAKAVGPTGCVLAFEPIRHNYTLLCANIALNNLMDRVRCHMRAVGAHNAPIRVPALSAAQGANYGGFSLVDPSAGATEMALQIAIDDLQLPACDFLKADVEGMECEVLTGATKTIHSKKPVLFVENDRPLNADNLLRTLRAFNYRIFSHTTPLFNPANYLGNTENVIEPPNACSFNLLCFHETARIQTNLPEL